MKKVIQTQDAPAPIGPYNQAIQFENTLYVSGQIAIDPKTGEMVMDSIETETEMVLKNLGAVLSAAGFDYSDVVKCSIFISDMGQFANINEVYAKYFDGPSAPARETVQVAVLPKNVNVEISCIAVR
ncbi:RidA family protein [Phaeocystidibacter luteus]|uniref:RidA family protein n=1 Tax=Phaeocystidibacter luteus TaxID=911197 RepID=A0A6N6RMG2_9FLAO|nr:RidA family protein [Phaeocystidibacter luteus]KAB2814774.1 RidA family protein [Phaeocystidibacter luteus]